MPQLTLKPLLSTLMLPSDAVRFFLLNNKISSFNGTILSTQITMPLLARLAQAASSAGSLTPCLPILHQWVLAPLKTGLTTLCFLDSHYHVILSLPPIPIHYLTSTMSLVAQAGHGRCLKQDPLPLNSNTQASYRTFQPNQFRFQKTRNSVIQLNQKHGRPVRNSLRRMLSPFQAPLSIVPQQFPPVVPGYLPFLVLHCHLTISPCHLFGGHPTQVFSQILTSGAPNCQPNFADRFSRNRLPSHPLNFGSTVRGLYGSP